MDTLLVRAEVAQSATGAAGERRLGSETVACTAAKRPKSAHIVMATTMPYTRRLWATNHIVNPSLRASVAPVRGQLELRDLAINSGSKIHATRTFALIAVMLHWPLGYGGVRGIRERGLFTCRSIRPLDGGHRAGSVDASHVGSLTFGAATGGLPNRERTS